MPSTEDALPAEADNVSSAEADNVSPVLPRFRPLWLLENHELCFFFLIQKPILQPVFDPKHL
jgi:hypothetical protein